MFSYWAYILVGRNDTGKTTFQRHLAFYLCGRRYQRLPINTVNNISHPRSPKGLETLFTANRSYQEKKSLYKSVGNYFEHFFVEADVCFLSSHSQSRDVARMIEELRRRCYNVAGIFWSNAYGARALRIAQLSWDEVFWIHNPFTQNNDEIEARLELAAREFSEMILARAQLW